MVCAAKYVVCAAKCMVCAAKGMVCAAKCMERAAKCMAQVKWYAGPNEGGGHKERQGCGNGLRRGYGRRLRAHWSALEPRHPPRPPWTLVNAVPACTAQWSPGQVSRSVQPSQVVRHRRAVPLLPDIRLMPFHDAPSSRAGARPSRRHVQTQLACGWQSESPAQSETAAAGLKPSWAAGFLWRRRVGQTDDQILTMSNSHGAKCPP